MELLFLGTSSGVPSKERNVTALAVMADNGKGWFLVDCGEATQHQVQYTHLSFHTLQAIFITHLHGDHCYGLPGFLASATMAGRTADLPFIAPRAVWNWLQATQEHTELHLSFKLQFFAVEDFTGWQNDELRLESIPLSHRVPSYACCFTEIQRPTLDAAKLQAANIPQGQIWGQLQRGQDVSYQGQTLHAADYLHYPHSARRIVVGGDNDQVQLLREVCAHAQVLVHEATYCHDVWLKVGAQVQHSSAQQVAEFAEEIGLANLVLTHFSPRYQNDASRSPSIADIEQEARAHYHGNLIVARDFARYRLAKDGQFSCLHE
ncbi:MAG: ribonuclease Z [Burkholderiales bacterium]|nr:ribonuclease Z [Burkholderiales bacterium]